jgi:hypothetical protein
LETPTSSEVMFGVIAFIGLTYDILFLAYMLDSLKTT